MRALGYVRRNAVAFLALFVALGGTATAAHLAVNSSDVVDESLQSVDIRNGQVASSDIEDYSVGLVDLRGNSVQSNRVIDDSLMGIDIVESTLGKVPNAATLNGRTASGISRASHTSQREYEWSEDGRAAIASTELTVPHDGYVLLVGGAVVRFVGGCGWCFAHLRFQNTTDGTTTNTTAASVREEDETHVSLQHSALVRVLKGTHTFELIGSWNEASDEGVAAPDFGEETLTALYVPYNGTGRTGPGRDE